MPTPQSPSIQARVDRRTRFPRERRASRFLTVRASSGRTASGTSSTSRRPTTCQLHAKQEEKHERSERITQKNRQQRVEHTHTHGRTAELFGVFPGWSPTLALKDDVFYRCAQRGSPTGFGPVGWGRRRGDASRVLTQRRGAQETQSRSGKHDFGAQGCWRMCVDATSSFFLNTWRSLSPRGGS